jgi:ectoine hydroxylase-related dioxygenase (phytanoyl-CoA dioxygenase family)
VNRTDQRRAAILEAMTPSFLMPFVDTSLPYKQFMKGPVIDQLLKRDQTAFAELMVHKVIGPGGMGAISIDKELTELFQA